MERAFGRLPAEKVSEFLDFLVSGQELHRSGEQYFWMADAYPASLVSLRSASPDNVILQVDDGGKPASIGQVDRPSASWMVHPGAVYMHEGQQYFVEKLNLEKEHSHPHPGCARPHHRTVDQCRDHPAEPWQTRVL